MRQIRMSTVLGDCIGLRVEGKVRSGIFSTFPLDIPHICKKQIQLVKLSRNAEMKSNDDRSALLSALHQFLLDINEVVLHYWPFQQQQRHKLTL
jgi:hypothetical protein